MKDNLINFLKSKRGIIVVLILIVLLGAGLRFYKLGEVPSSLNWDEVSWGYNSYSILQTGHDEYGNFMPLSFKAFGDFKQPIYVYAGVPFIKVFGLSPFAVRAPSAFFGTLSILFVFLLTFELFRKKENALGISLLAAFFYAVSPWSIQFSRVAYEANLALFFVISGSWVFLRGVNFKRNSLLILGIFLLAISTYTYHSAKVLTAPWVSFLIFISFWTKSLKRKTAVLLVVLFILFISAWVIDSRTTQRGRGVLFVSDPAVVRSSVQENLYDKNNGDTFGQLIHNRRVVWAYKYVENYLSHFDFNWLFIRGDNPRHHTPDMGNLYLINLPFILFGIFLLLKKPDKSSLILFVWLMLGPVASSLALDSPNASRSMAMLPTWDIFAAIGWIGLASILSKKPKLAIFIILPIALLVLNFAYYTHQYFVHTDTQVQKDWQYGYKEAILYAQKFNNSDKRIIFSKTFEQPYAFYLFYEKYNPSKYISQGGSARIWQPCFNIDNAYFGNCIEKLRSGDIYISFENENLDNAELLKTFAYAYGEPVVRIYEKR